MKLTFWIFVLNKLRCSEQPKFFIISYLHGFYVFLGKAKQVSKMQTPATINLKGRSPHFPSLKGRKIALLKPGNMKFKICLLIDST